MNPLSALAKLGSLAMMLHMLGFVRDMIIVRMLSMDDATGAFPTAFKLSDLLRWAFAEDASSQAFAPVLAEHCQTKLPEATRKFVQYVAGMLTLALTVVIAVDALTAPWITRATAAGFGKNPDKLALATDLLRIVFSYILLISFSPFVGSVLNIYHKFQTPAFTPVLLNISLIVAVLPFMPHSDPPIATLTWAVFIGDVLQLVFQLPWLTK